MNISDLEIEDLIQLMRENDLTEIKLKNGKISIEISRLPAGGVQGNLSVIGPETHHSHPEPGNRNPVTAPDRSAAGGGNFKEVKSPLVGTFYRAPGPDKDPFVKEGDQVKEGDTLCIVEAMKSMNEIKAECTGTVLEICAENAQPVEYDQLLFKIR